MIDVDIPGRGRLRLEHAVFDLNGTLSLDGVLLSEVPALARELSQHLRCLLLTADTFGTGDEVAKALGFEFRRVGDGEEKRRVVADLGANRVVAVGNGQNDAPMFEAAALSIAVLGPEGSSTAALQAADIAARDIEVAMAMLLHPVRLVATLRA